MGFHHCVSEIRVQKFKSMNLYMSEWYSTWYMGTFCTMNTLRMMAQALTFQGVTQTESQQRHWLSYMRFPQSLQVNPATLAHNRPQVPPSTSFPIHNYMVIK